MERFNALGRGMQIMLVAGVLLLIDTFLDWQAVDDFPGISAWHGFLGVVMGLLTIVLIAWLVARVAAIDIPLPVSAAMISAVLGGLILLLAVLKNLTDDFSTFWSVVGVILAAAIAVGAWLEIQAAGGFNALTSEASTMRSSSGSRMSEPVASSPPPPPPATPESEAASAPAESPPMSESDHDHDHDPPSDDPATRRDA